MTDRRQSILDAAQKLFLERGYAATSITDIRVASGASVGSIYHAFGSKEAIATALVERAVAGWTNETRGREGVATAKDVIQATVEGLLRWSAAHPEQFRVLDELRAVSARGQAVGALAQLMSQARMESGASLAAYVNRGEIRNLPISVLQALVLGPAYEFLRVGGGSLPANQLDEVLAILNEAAWRAVAV